MLPLPLTVPAGRVISWKVLNATAPRLPTCGPSIAGLVFQVVASVNVVFVIVLNTPPLVESLVTNSLSFAELTVEPAGRPETVKRTNDCLADVDPPTACSSLPLLAAVGLACDTYTSAAGANVNVPPVAGGAVGVAVTCVEFGDSPLALTARTTKKYCVPLVRPVFVNDAAVSGVALTGVVPNVPEVVERYTLYPVAPLTAVHLSATWAFPAVAVKPVGAVGGVPAGGGAVGVAVTCAEFTDWPWALTARTTKKYCVPLVRPVFVNDAAVSGVALT